MLTLWVSRLLLMMMTSSLAVVVVETVVVDVMVLVMIAVAVERDVAESLSSTTMPSLLYEQAVPASAAQKVNIKCPSHYSHASQCE